MTHKISTFLSVSRQLLQVGEPAKHTANSLPVRFESNFLNHRGAENTERRGIIV
ncbi:MAG: hypothetical protein RMZ41_018530 [Nostoc sp. DedVER02]